LLVCARIGDNFSALVITVILAPYGDIPFAHLIAKHIRLITSFITPASLIAHTSTHFNKRIK